MPSFIGNWKTIESFPYPIEELSNYTQEYLLYSPKVGIVIGSCTLLDAETKEFSFTFSSESWDIEPTHWMELPSVP